MAEGSFGERVALDEPAMIKAIGSNVAQYVTVKTFVEALRKLVISELEPRNCSTRDVSCRRRHHFPGHARRWLLANRFSI
jgi:hypothetical protein